ncbi:hypothetical protein JOF57_002436 [Mycolicibacterium lutetiense]|uniref:Uncharacterized protein n=1 Tax=Mycolicibacterium lutetiense TaxID=1641992 RepID=A0ABS4ZSR2_9MYCO|nr:hypothetical protein [Mycolicibacterium lutetiense]
MSPPNDSRPGGLNTTEATNKSHAQDCHQNTPSGYGRAAPEEVNRG